MFGILLLVTSLLQVATAQDAIRLSAVRTVAVGGAPSVTFHSAVDGSLDAALTCGGRRFSLAQAIQPGASYTLTLAGLPAGSHRCSGQVALTASDGTSGTMPLTLEVALRPPPTLQVRDEDLDLRTRTLVLRSDRPLGDVQVDVYGPGAARIGGVRIPGEGRAELPLEWASDGEVVRIDVVAADVDGIQAKLELLPWSYDIPHEDVVFETNSDVIRPDEVPKLQKAWDELVQVQARYGSVVEVALFVVGCTDTVGTAASNLDLSARRARAIAAWFQSRGFQGKISYQGVGESLLAAPTADEVAEPKNRRVIYILAARPPKGVGVGPGAWRPL